jgi:mycothiol synthase
MCTQSSLDAVTIRVRTCSSPAELQRSLEIYNEVWPHRAVTAEDVEAWKRAAIASVEFLGMVDGVEAGSAAAALEASRTKLVAMPLTVLAPHRRAGVGSALLEAATSWAAAQGAQQIETRVEADDRESLEFALRRGFHEHSREDGLELTLSGLEPPSLDPPAGVEIVTLAERPELARGVYEVAAEALPDVPGSEDWLPPPFDRFATSHLRGLVVFVALAAGDAIGYAKLVGRPDGRTADHGITAVRRDWRNRGVARALKRAQIAWATTHGIERLTAANEERNAPMQHINSLLGFRLVPGRVRLRAPVG